MRAAVGRTTALRSHTSRHAKENASGANSDRQARRNGTGVVTLAWAVAAIALIVAALLIWVALRLKRVGDRLGQPGPRRETASLPEFSAYFGAQPSTAGTQIRMSDTL